MSSTERPGNRSGGSHSSRRASEGDPSRRPPHAAPEHHPKRRLDVRPDQSGGTNWKDDTTPATKVAAAPSSGSAYAQRLARDRRGHRGEALTFPTRANHGPACCPPPRAWCSPALGQLHGVRRAHGKEPLAFSNRVGPVRGSDHLHGRWPPARLTADTPSESLAALANSLAPTAWHRIRWGRGHEARPLEARASPPSACWIPKSRSERWLLCQESLGRRRPAVLLQQPAATTPVRPLVRIARSRWAIEVQYRDLKSELGLDHFEGCSYPGLDPSRRPRRDDVHVSPVRTPPARTDPLPTFPGDPQSGARDHGRLALDRAPGLVKTGHRFSAESAAENLTM